MFFRVSSSLGLAVCTALLISACGKSSPASPSPSPNPNPSGSTASIVSGASTRGTNAYSPNPVSVSVGATVTWMNNDGITHTATSNTGAFDTQNIGAGASKSVTFSTAGTFQYHCSIHPGMMGTVIVQ
jgi:plastocyanin